MNSTNTHSGIVVKGGTLKEAVIIHAPGGSLDDLYPEKSWKTGELNADSWNNIYNIRVVIRSKEDGGK